MKEPALVTVILLLFVGILAFPWVAYSAWKLRYKQVTLSQKLLGHLLLRGQSRA